MTTIAPKSKQIEPAPEGTHIARCYQFIHVGTNMGEYMGTPKEFNKIRLSFELPNELKVWKEGEEAKPIVVSQEYTLSMSEKANLRKLVEGMIGKSMVDGEADMFDVESLVGMPCLITIKHKTSAKGNVRAEISSASPLMKGMTAPAQVNPSKILSYDNFNDELFNSLPDFIKDDIITSKEYKKMMGVVVDEEESINPDDIPF